MEKISFKDGNDYIVVFKNCNEEEIALIEEKIAPQKIKDSYLESLPNIEMKFVDGEYKGYTALEALAKDGDKALRILLKRNDDEMSESTNAALKEYIAFKLRGIGDSTEYVSKWSKRKCDAFFTFCGPWISEEDKKEFACGYAEYSDFLKFGLIQHKKSAAAKIISKITQNSKKEA